MYVPQFMSALLLSQKTYSYKTIMVHPQKCDYNSEYTYTLLTPNRRSRREVTGTWNYYSNGRLLYFSTEKNISTVIISSFISDSQLYTQNELEKCWTPSKLKSMFNSQLLCLLVYYFAKGFMFRSMTIMQAVKLPIFMYIWQTHDVDMSPCFK